MKINERQLRRMIKESIRQVLREEVGDIDYGKIDFGHDDEVRNMIYRNACLIRMAYNALHDKRLSEVEQLEKFCKLHEYVISQIEACDDERYPEKAEALEDLNSTLRVFNQRLIEARRKVSPADIARKANAIMNEIQELGLEENGLGRIRDLLKCSTPQIIIDFVGDMRNPRYKAGEKSGWENEKTKCLKIAEKYDCDIHIIRDSIVFTLNRHFDKKYWEMRTIPLFDNYGKPKS